MLEITVRCSLAASKVDTERRHTVRLCHVGGSTGHSGNHPTDDFPILHDDQELDEDDPR